RHPVAAEPLLPGHAQLAVPRAGRDDHRTGQVGLTLDDDPLGVGRQVHLGHVLGAQLGTEPLRLLAHGGRQVRAPDPAREAGGVGRGKGGKFWRSVVFMRGAAGVTDPSNTTGLSWARAAYSAAVYPAGPDPMTMTS